MSDADDIRYSTVVFLKAVLPTLKTLVQAKPGLQKLWGSTNAIVQISACAPDGEFDHNGKLKDAMHFEIVDGNLQPRLKGHQDPDFEIEFKNREDLVTFFKGGLALPVFRGFFKHPTLLVKMIVTLLTLSGLMSAEEPPKDPDDAALLTKMMFYLLSTGISQLNKVGHPVFKDWAKKQPDRVFQLSVQGEPDISAYVRVKGGRTKASRGLYTRSRPFFELSFDTVPSALGTLLEIDDMVEATASGKIIMAGAPEIGAIFGDLLLMIGGYAK